jgi:cell division septation protein DedD
MSDPGFREINLSGKHVVFLFMAFSVVAVGLFLLGVSVGKGITKEDVANAQATPSPTSTPADAPAGAAPDSTKPKPGELDYFRTLQGSPAASPKPAESPAVTPSATPAEPPAAPPAAATAPKPTPSPSPEKPAAKPAAATGTLYVYVDTFSSRANANTRLAELKKKGFSNVSVQTAGTTAKPAYRVRVGPFDDQPSAEAARARLIKEGYKSSLIR